MSKAAKIIELLGGAGEISRALGIEHTTVWRWTQPKARRGTDGYIPRGNHDALLRLAGKKRKRAAVAALLGA